MGDTGTHGSIHLDRRDQLRAGHRPGEALQRGQRKSVRFHQLNGQTGVRIQQKRVDPSTGDEVAYDDIVKGFELGARPLRVIEPGELESLEPKKTKTIEIEDFVDLADIDPILYDHPYYLAPGAGGAKPYRLLLDAMRESGKVAIAQGRHPPEGERSSRSARWRATSSAMATMIFADEVVDPDRIDELDSAREVEVNDRELDDRQAARRVARGRVRARQVPRHLPRGRPRPHRAQGGRRGDRRAAGQEEDEEPVPDLMAALKASLASATADRRRARTTARPSKTKAPPSARRRPREELARTQALRAPRSAPRAGSAARPAPRAEPRLHPRGDLVPPGHARCRRPRARAASRGRASRGGRPDPARARRSRGARGARRARPSTAWSSARARRARVTRVPSSSRNCMTAPWAGRTAPWPAASSRGVELGRHRAERLAQQDREVLGRGARGGGGERR